MESLKINSFNFGGQDRLRLKFTTIASKSSFMYIRLMALVAVCRYENRRYIRQLVAYKTYIHCSR
jgi:hypothetical protein